YAAAKAGLVGLSRVIAAEFGAQGLRSNCLLPGGTDTEAGREFAHTPESIAFVEGMHALKRMASPEEIARAGLILASDASSFMTGAAALVDGGVSISKTWGSAPLLGLGEGHLGETFGDIARLPGRLGQEDRVLVDVGRHLGPILPREVLQVGLGA